MTTRTRDLLLSAVPLALVLGWFAFLAVRPVESVERVSISEANVGVRNGTAEEAVEAARRRSSLPVVLPTELPSPDYRLLEIDVSLAGETDATIDRVRIEYDELGTSRRLTIFQHPAGRLEIPRMAPEIQTGHADTAIWMLGTSPGGFGDDTPSMAFIVQDETSDRVFRFDHNPMPSQDEALAVIESLLAAR